MSGSLLIAHDGVSKFSEGTVMLLSLLCEPQNKIQIDNINVNVVLEEKTSRQNHESKEAYAQVMLSLSGSESKKYGLDAM
jgi:hypothetical protein